MDTKELRRRETEALIEAIWGSQAGHVPAPPDATRRSAQNRALASAMRAYLHQYLAEADAAAPTDVLGLRSALPPPAKPS